MRTKINSGQTDRREYKPPKAPQMSVASLAFENPDRQLPFLIRNNGRSKSLKDPGNVYVLVGPLTAYHVVKFHETFKMSPQRAIYVLRLLSDYEAKRNALVLFAGSSGYEVEFVKSELTELLAKRDGEPLSEEEEKHVEVLETALAARSERMRQEENFSIATNKALDTLEKQIEYLPDQDAYRIKAFGAVVPCGDVFALNIAAFFLSCGGVVTGVSRAGVDVSDKMHELDEEALFECSYDSTPITIEGVMRLLDMAISDDLIKDRDGVFSAILTKVGAFPVLLEDKEKEAAPQGVDEDEEARQDEETANPTVDSTLKPSTASAIAKPSRKRSPVPTRKSTGVKRAR